MTKAQARGVVHAYDKIAGEYDAQYTSPRCEAENLRFFGPLARLASTAADVDVVDVGCGTGLLLDYVTVDPDHYVGIDISGGMLAEAYRRHPGYGFVKADMQNMPINDDSADVIVSGFTAFNYVPDHERVIAEMHRVLRSGGGVHLCALGPRCVVRGTYALYLDDGDVVPRYPMDAEVLRALFEAGGFADVRVEGMTYLADKLIPDWAPRWAASAFLRLESRTAGRLCPSNGDFILLTARKV